MDGSRAMVWRRVVKGLCCSRTQWLFAKDCLYMSVWKRALDNAWRKRTSESFVPCFGRTQSCFVWTKLLILLGCADKSWAEGCIFPWFAYCWPVPFICSRCHAPAGCARKLATVLLASGYYLTCLVLLAAQNWRSAVHSPSCVLWCCLLGTLLNKNAWRVDVFLTSKYLPGCFLNSGSAACQHGSTGSCFLDATFPTMFCSLVLRAREFHILSLSLCRFCSDFPTCLLFLTMWLFLRDFLPILQTLDGVLCAIKGSNGCLRLRLLCFIVISISHFPNISISRM